METIIEQQPNEPIALAAPAAPPAEPPAGLLRPPETPTVPRHLLRVVGREATVVERPVIAEIALTVFVDGRELVTLMCTPWKLNCLVLGFLYLEGVIDSADDVAALRVCVADRVAEVTLTRPVELPQRRVVTSGCTGGTSFRDYLEEVQRQRVPSDRQVGVDQLYRLMRELHQASHLYHQSRGVHAAALSDGESLLVVAEDVGRHNCLDKIAGECLLREQPTADHLLL